MNYLLAVSKGYLSIFCIIPLHLHEHSPLNTSFVQETALEWNALCLSQFKEAFLFHPSSNVYITSDVSNYHLFAYFNVTDSTRITACMPHESFHWKAIHITPLHCFTDVMKGVPVL